MAAAITTDTTLRAALLVPGATLNSLQNSDDFADDDSVALHTAAWTETKKELKQQSPPVEESDLTDPTELQDAVHFRVLYKLFHMSEIEEDKIAAAKWLSKFDKELRTVNLSTPTEQPAASAQTHLVRS